MDSPVAKIIMLAATIAITVAVVAVTWRVVGSNTPSTDKVDISDKAQIQHETLCTAVGGGWDSTKTPPCQ